MQRQRLLELLNDYRRTYPHEAEVAARIAHLVDAHHDCFDRTCRPGHITGSAWVLSHDRQRCLLVHHRKLSRWLQPGGHADGDGDVGRVALREAVEESGLTGLQLAEQSPFDLDVHLIPARVDPSGQLLEDAHEHHDVRFLVVANDDQLPQASDESNAVAWFTRDEVIEATDEQSVLRMMHKAGPW